MRAITADDRNFIISFDYEPELVALVKELPMRDFKKKTKTWTVPIAFRKQVEEFAKEYGFTLTKEAASKASLPMAVDEEIRLPDMGSPLPNGNVPFDHQKSGVAFLVPRRRAILADDMGLGKTLQALFAAKAFNIKTIVIAPASLQENWKREAENVGVEISVYTWGKMPMMLSEDFVLIGDECFTYETKVQTEIGAIEIGLIVESMLPVRVWTQSSDGQLELRSIARFIERETTSPLLQICHEHGEIVCTGNHKIWTEEYGYITAKEISDTSKNENFHLRILSQSVSGEVGGPKKVLHKRTCKYLSFNRPRHQGTPTDNIATYEHAPSSNLRKETGCVCSDEAKQSHEKPSYKGKDAAEPNWTGVQASRGERSSHKAATSSFGSLEFANGSSRFHRNGKTFIQSTTSELLQGRPCSPGVKNSDRGRRNITQVNRQAGSRPTQGRGFIFSRVVSVKVLELGNRQQFASSNGRYTRVYNLEVEDNHNYFANNILVSNCHYAQAGNNSQRGKRFLEITQDEHCKAVFCLTGTPLKNGRPINFLPLLQAVRHPLSMNITGYQRRYCDAKATRFCRWDVSGATNLKELHELTKDVMLRRKKEDCLDLPGKIRVHRAIEWSKEDKLVYDTRFAELQAVWRERVAKGIISDESEALVAVGHLRQAASAAKVSTAIEIAEELRGQHQSIVIFTAYKETARYLNNHYEGRAYLLTGDTPVPERQGLVDGFQRGDRNIFVATIGAGGIGITLTKAQTVIMLDRPWTPGDTEQAEDRLYRIGQKNMVTSIWLQANEIDKAVDAILEAKAEVIELVLNGKRKRIARTSTERQITKTIAEMIF